MRVLDRAMLERLGAALTQQQADLRREIETYGADPGSDDVTFDADTGFSDRSHSTEERARVIAVVRAGHDGSLQSSLMPSQICGAPGYSAA